MATKFFTIKYVAQERPAIKANPGSAFASSDVNRLVGMSSGYAQNLVSSTALSTTIGLNTYNLFGVLRGLPDGTCTAKSTQYVYIDPIGIGDILSVRLSSDVSTSGVPYSSDVGKTVGLKGNGLEAMGLSTVGTLLTQGPIRGMIVAAPSTSRVDVQIVGLNVTVMTTA